MITVRILKTNEDLSFWQFEEKCLKVKNMAEILESTFNIAK